MHQRHRLAPQRIRPWTRRSACPLPLTAPPAPFARSGAPARVWAGPWRSAVVRRSATTSHAAGNGAA